MEHGLRKIESIERKRSENLSDARYENTEIQRLKTSLHSEERLASFSLYEPINDIGPIKKIQDLFSMAVKKPGLDEIIRKMLDIIQTFGEEKHQIFSYNNDFIYAKAYAQFIDDLYEKYQNEVDVLSYDRSFITGLRYNQEVTNAYGDKYQKDIDLSNKKNIDEIKKDVHELFITAKENNDAEEASSKVVLTSDIHGDIDDLFA